MIRDSGLGMGDGWGRQTSPLLIPMRASISQLSSTRAACSFLSWSSKLSIRGSVGVGAAALLGARDLPLEDEADGAVGGGGGPRRGGWARDWRSWAGVRRGMVGGWW